MTDKLNYQVDHLDQKVKDMHLKLESLKDEVNELDKELGHIKKDGTQVADKVKEIVKAKSWVLRTIGGAFITAVALWVIGGGLDK